MKKVMILLFGLISFLLAESRYPVPIIPFQLTYDEIYPHTPTNYLPQGLVIVEFTINSEGHVIDPIIEKNKFDFKVNNIILDKIKETKYTPATQNGRPIEVRYTFPIQFK
tara:strand:- start:120 stop:449 length:330 start_codon:yes stop_codon:yes gene_type:complete